MLTPIVSALLPLLASDRNLTPRSAMHFNALTIWSHMNFARLLFHVLVRAPTGLYPITHMALDTQRSVPLTGFIVLSVMGAHPVMKVTGFGGIQRVFLF
jgi:hypothetical protein